MIFKDQNTCSDFFSAQPDDYLSEDCLMMYPDGKWNDLNCNNSLTYLCEKISSKDILVCYNKNIAYVCLFVMIYYRTIILLKLGHYHCSQQNACLLYTSPSPRDLSTSRMPSSA